MADKAITAANVIASASAQIQDGVVAAATTVTAGQPLYMLANGTLGLADADGTSPANSIAGISVNGASAGQPVKYASRDSSFTFGGTGLAGDVLYLSDTPGGVTTTIGDLEAGDKVTVLGVLLTTTTMNLSPVVGGVIAA